MHHAKKTTAAQAAATPVERLEDRRLLAASALQPGFIEVIDVFDENGNLENTNVIEVPFDGAIQVADGSGVSLRGAAVNPISLADKRTVVDVFNVRVKPGNNNVLQFQTENLVTEGGQLYFYGEGIQDANGDFIRREPGESRMRMPRGLDKYESTLANRQFRSYFEVFMSSDNFADSPPPLEGTVYSEDVLRDALAYILRLRRDAGQITAQERLDAVARFDSDFARAVIPNATLRAGLMSLTGTSGEPAIAAILDGDNITGKPWTVVDFSDAVSANAPVAETVNNGGRLRTLFQSDLNGEYFTALGAVLAHEVLHQDQGNTVNEEIVANAVESLVYAEQIQTYPVVSRTRTAMVNQMNGRLLSLLNSGDTNYPNVGLNAAPLDTPTAGGFLNVFVDDQGVPGTGYEGFTPRSFADDVRFEYTERGFNTGSTQLNNTAKQILANIMDLDSPDQVRGNLFSQDVIDQLDDRQGSISPRAAVEIAGRLGTVWFLV